MALAAGDFPNQPGLGGAVMLLDLVGQALFVVDTDWRISDANHAAEEICGEPREAILGQRIVEWCESTVGVAFAREVASGLTHQVSVTADVYSERCGKWCEARMVPLQGAAILICRDVTARTVDLQKSTERHRAIVETAVDGIITIDEQGTADTFNPAAERIFGYPASEVIGRNVSLLMPEPYASEHDGYLQRYLQTGQSRIIGVGREVTGRRKDGSVFPMRLSVGQMTLGGQRMFLGIVHDLTDHRRVEDQLRQIEVRTQTLRDQAALRRVATVVAAECTPAEIFSTVAHEVASLLGSEAGLVCRFENESAAPVGWWGAWQGTLEAVFPLGREGVLRRVRGTHAPARAEGVSDLADDALGQLAATSGYPCCVAAPIMLGTRPWGAVLAATARSAGFDLGDEDRLADFAEIVALAVANAADRERLEAMSVLDHLTGLPNPSSFREHLHSEARRARRDGFRLGLVVIDVDRFRQINHRFGHAAGDDVLRAVAGHLVAEAGAGAVARIGGEEFAWLLPHTDHDGTVAAAERLRQAIADREFPGVGRVTVSAGTCELSELDPRADGEELMRLAEGALHWAKTRGRNMVCRYSSDIAEPLSLSEQVVLLQNRQVLSGLRILARAVDAKDPSTHEHSVRVAELAVQLATVAGWPAGRMAQLHETGLVHDVGKIGVPDAILLKPGPLTPEEYEIVKRHATLGAEIVAETLPPQQVMWVRHHHERYDGAGYPDGLAGDDIPDGSRIIAVADSWDVMTTDRPYRMGIPVDKALREVQEHSGRQFCPAAVELLEQLWDAGVLAGG